MIVQSKEIKLKDGNTCILRSPEEADAEAMLLHDKKTAGETYFLSRYAEEVDTPLERKRQMIKDMREDTGCLLLSVFVGERPIATIGLNGVSRHIKMRHRATFGLFVEQEYWGMGLGSRLVDEVILAACQMGYEQLEIGVFADNDRARGLYLKKGFEEWGQKRRGYRLKDGTYIDEIIMGKYLNPSLNTKPEHMEEKA